MSNSYVQLSMDNAIARLSRAQIKNFFSDTSVTQQQCDDFAAGILQVAAKDIRSTPSQGGASYTVMAASSRHVLQFRASGYALNLDLLSCVEVVYGPFVAHHEDLGLLGDLPIYKMTDIGGAILYLARENLQRNNLLQNTLRDYARFFASAWLNTPGIPARLVPNPQSLLNGYLGDLKLLSTGLPSRFRPTVNHLIEELPRLFEDDWPMVPNHTDLRDNNIHVDPKTGRLVGICDWGDTAFSPFGMSLWGLETVLGVEKTNGWVYYTNQQDLRAIFWDAFRGALECMPDDRIEIARLTGIFLVNGWQFDDEEEKIPLQEGHRCLKFLEDAILGLPTLPRLNQVYLG